MGLHRKVTCRDCEHYHQCSQQTRLFVNYCGSRTKAVQAHIISAIAECRSRQGLLFQRSNLTPLSRLKAFANH